MPVLRGNHQKAGQGLQALREGRRINALRAFIKCGGFAAGKSNVKSLRQQAFLLGKKPANAGASKLAGPDSGFS
jgi:hypothetical protein